ncbi:MAG: hypothetical protein E7612_03805 [Ruminococcaceae bacterium]|nr:hypothetical protein [Oscillospiraceae bacterium]
MKICSFFGHREIEVTNSLYATVTAEILRAVDFGCRIFYFGGYGEYDALCYKIVTELQKRIPDIKRIYCVAREEYLRKMVRYFNKDDYDDIIFLQPSFNGWYKSIYFRNCAMIDESDYIIFYAEERENSGAYKAFKYAKKRKEKCVINLWH